MDEIAKFQAEVADQVRAIGASEELQELGSRFVNAVAPYRYCYNFSWMGRPIIQYPQDIVAMQEVLWATKPDLVIETGIAHGGSLVFYASLLELIGKGRVLGIDIDIRAHNRAEIERHPMYHRIDMIEGSSTDPEIARRVAERATEAETVLVTLDSHHTHEHVRRELELYAPLVTPGSYCVVFDTVIQDMPAGSFPDREWDVGDNPKTAVHDFIEANDHFEIDRAIHGKLLITVSRDGFLRRLR